MCTERRIAVGIRRQAGVSYIELIVFIVVVLFAVVGVLRVFNQTAQKSADPQVRKQMLAAAEALLEEVELKAFTICDPDDPNAATATSSASCASGNDENTGSGPNGLGAEAGETRATYDNVSDYDGFTVNPLTDANGGQLAGFSASIGVARDSIGSVAANESLRITVTVTRGTDSLSLTGYRLRYAPRAVP